MKSRLISAVLVLLMLLTLLPAAVMAEDTAGTPTITIVSKEANMKAGTTVSVDVEITNNPGVVTMTIPVTWDKTVLKLTAVKNTGGVLTKTDDCNGWLGSTDYDTAQTNGVYYLAWDNDLAPANFTGNGTLCTMVFEVLEAQEIDAETTIQAVMGEDENVLPIANVMNYDMQDLKGEIGFEVGTLKFVEKVVVLGDVDDSGKINALDLLNVKKYIVKLLGDEDINVEAADVDKSGKVNALDLLLLKKYIVKLIDTFE